MVAVVLLLVRTPQGMVNFFLCDSRTEEHQHQVILGGIS